MHDSTGPAARRIAEEAGHWLLASRDGLDEASRIAFVQWLRHSPAHVAEYVAMVQLDQDLKDAAAGDPTSAPVLVEQAAREPAVIELRSYGAALSPDVSHRRGARQRRRGRWIAAAALVTAAALTMALFVAWPRHDVPAGIVYTAPDDAVRSIDLADGSRIQLDRGSRIRVVLTTDYRDIAVLGGTMLLDVGHGSSAPLTVTLDRSVLRDVGTVFQVRATPGAGEVTVLSGRVDVMTADDDRSWPWSERSVPQVVARLQTGDRATLARDGQLKHREPHGDLSAALAWLPAEIAFRDAPVAEVARRFNDYGQLPLVVDDQSLADTRISGRFHARDPSGFLAYLQTLPGVQVRRDSDGVHIVRREALPRHARL